MMDENSPLREVFVHKRNQTILCTVRHFQPLSPTALATSLVHGKNLEYIVMILRGLISFALCPLLEYLFRPFQKGVGTFSLVRLIFPKRDINCFSIAHGFNRHFLPIMKGKNFFFLACKNICDKP